MTDIIDRLKEPEAHYPGNFDTPKRANAMLSCLCQEAMEEIESLRRELKDMTNQYNAALEAEQVRYRHVVEKDAEIERLNSKLQSQALDCIAADGQAFDSWQQLAASQASEQQFREMLKQSGMMVDAFFPPGDTAALQSMITKAGEVMRERTHSAMLDLKPWDHRGEIIRSIPAVTLDDLKCSN